MPKKNLQRLLRQLMHLKQYEKPDPLRMARNKQNIIRKVHLIQSEQRPSLAVFPDFVTSWFSPVLKYGIAALFVVFGGLQYLDINLRDYSIDMDVRNPIGNLASFEFDEAIVSNRYPDLPSSYQLFTPPEGNESVVPVVFEFKR